MNNAWIPPDNAVTGHGGFCECNRCHQADYAIDDIVNPYADPIAIAERQAHEMDYARDRGDIMSDLRS